MCSKYVEIVLGERLIFLIDFIVFESFVGFTEEPMLDAITHSNSLNSSVAIIRFRSTKSLIYTLV